MRIALAVIAAALMLATQAAAGLATDPVIFSAGEWSVRKSKDPITDKTSCTALYGKRLDIQLGSDRLYFSLRGRGDMQGYVVRIDDDPAIHMQLATPIERKISAFGITGPTFKQVLSAKRLRTQAITIFNSTIDEDISLEGAAEAYAAIMSPECR